MAYLFHYTSIYTLLTILDENTLKFNTINCVNDAYESKLHNIYDIEKKIYNIWQNQKGQYEDKIYEINDEIEKIKNEIDDGILEYKDIKYFQGKKKAEIFKNKDILPLKSKYSDLLTKKRLENNKLEKHKYDDLVYKIKIYNKYSEYRKIGYNDLRNGLVKVACFCTGKFNVDKKVKSNILNSRQGFYHPRMWAQYADNSKGCCIIFKKGDLKIILNKLSDDYHVYEGLINYVDLLNVRHINNINDVILDVYSDLSKQGIINYLIKNVKSLYFRKDIDWSDEKEYRLLLINKLKNRNKKPYYMDINNSIDSIILGEDFKLENDFELYLDSLKKICNKKLINLFILNNNLGEYHLNKENV